MENPFLDEVESNLPRLLALFDLDWTSSSFGIGDRYHWAWGLIDFGNGTFQGAAHGMARLWRAGLWPYNTDASLFFWRINSIFEGARLLTRKDGSLEEAFPYEGSYCVTALVAFDLLCALDLLEVDVEQERIDNWKKIIEPMIAYLIVADESHAIISNHLATSAAALFRWHRLTGEETAYYKAKILLNRVLENQSSEGWFAEYGGADPGYQSLCTYYLADIHLAHPELDLAEPLRRSIQFLWFFAHPDGSFGGLYGSRYTRFCYPAGFEALASEMPEAAALSEFIGKSIFCKKTVTLSSIDEPNFVPMFNAYAWAASIRASRNSSKSPLLSPELPSHVNQPLRVYFSQSGILIDRGRRHYTIINTKKGGIIYHFVCGRAVLVDAGAVVCDPLGRYGSVMLSNMIETNNQGSRIVEVCGSFSLMPKQLPSPSQFLVLRLLSVTIFRFGWFRELVKKNLVKMLISRRKTWPVRNKRKIELGEKLSVEDNIEIAFGYSEVKYRGSFIPIHMASQGYWQMQDEEGSP